MSMELGPYTNFHELNQDWFLNEFNKVLAEWTAMKKSFNDLNAAFNDLRNYVHDYFKNLDVQEEIDKKLDSMAKDGSLYAIIRKYTDPIVNEQNSKINVIENRMDTFTSLPQGSTSGDAELIDIRVPASGFNGNATYPNAGDAVRGQVSELNSDLADKALKKLIKKPYEVKNGWYNQDGFHSSIEYTSIKVNVVPGETIYITGSNNGAMPTFLYFSSNDTFISQHEEGYGYRNNVKSIVPTNASYVAVNSYLKTDQMYVANIDNDFNIDNVLDIMINKPLSVINGEFLNGYFGYGGFNESSEHKCLKVDISSFEKIYATGSANGAFPWYVFLDSTGNGIPNAAGSQDNKSYENVELNVPINAKYIGINSLHDTEKNMEVKAKNVNYDAYKYFPFLNKKGLLIGDSITDMGYYIDSLEDITNSTAYKNAIGGSTITNNGDSSISARIANIDFTKYDYVVIEGGTNDYEGALHDGQPIGTIEDEENTTFYGALNSICKTIINSNPNITLLFLTPTQRAGDWHPNLNGYKLIDYVDAIKKIGIRHSIPVLDLYAESGLNRYTLNTFTTDTLHWSRPFANKVGKMIGQKLNQLFVI